MLGRLGVSIMTIVVMLALAQLPAQSAGTAPVPFPTQPRGLQAPVALPAGLDATPRYQPQVSCSPSDMVGPRKLRDLVLATYRIGGRGNISRGCTEGLSEHSEGRAWDWMVNVGRSAEKAAAADFLAWLTASGGANAKRLGVMYVIYNKKIWGAYRASDGWRDSSGHTDHVHISFSWNGGRGNTSFWTGKVQPLDYGPCARFAAQPAVLRTTPRLAPCYSAAALVKKHAYSNQAYGSRASTVTTAQGLLGVSKTGVFDTATRTAVGAYQKRHDLPWNGTLDKPTWGSLRPSGVTSDVASGYTATTAARYGLATYGDRTYVERSTGKPILFLQVALRMPIADRNGYFGPRTLAAVKAFQTARGLPVTGKVTKVEWKALAGS